MIADSFERIHRSNLIGMGVLPLQFPRAGGGSLGLTGEERFWIEGWRRRARRGADARPAAGQGRAREGGREVEFDARVRIDTPREAEYFRHGGILQFVLRGCWPR